MKKFINLSLLTLLFAAIFSACNTNNPDGPKSDENIIPAQSIKSDKSITLFVDSTYKINVTVTPAEANEPLVWSSDNSNVATVNQQGVVTAISDGTCNISVSSGPLTAATKVTVINNPVTLELELYSVEQKKCTVTVVPSDEKGYYYCSFLMLRSLKYYLTIFYRWLINTRHMDTHWLICCNQVQKTLSLLDWLLTQNMSCLLLVLMLIIK